MHVTLIDPPRYTFPLNHASNVAIPPLGIAYIASSIESNDHIVDVIDSVGFYHELSEKYRFWGCLE